MAIDITNWRDTDINVDSLWIINERDKSGKHANVYHGNFIPQIPYQLIKRYTNEGETVLDMFTGSGTTLFECERLNRKFIGFDINNEMINYVNDRMNDNPGYKYSLDFCDITDTVQVDKCFTSASNKLEIPLVDLIISHPPYLDIIKFTDQKEDLSHICNINEFVEKYTLAVSNVFPYLKKGGYFALVAGDVYKRSEVVPLAFFLMYAIKKNFSVKLKGTIIKNIEGNKGKLGCSDIWRYRALKSDYYIFKHEYIFVFKKN